MPIPYGKHHITNEDIQAVVEVLQTDFLTQGPKIAEFEAAFAAYVGAKYAVAVANGTAALHLCTLALGVKTGDKVITSPITFVASANCVRYCGGEVVFVDIDPKTYLLDIEKVRSLLEAAPYGSYKGIIPIDFAGRPIDMEAFRSLADAFGLWIIEDSCHAPGGFFYDSNGVKQQCGNGKYADLAIFSFHPVKHIATGEGGMITTDDEVLHKRLLTLRTHGITRNPDDFKNSVSLAVGDTRGEHYPMWYMEMQDLGYNYRLTDFQAALGISQLRRADEGIERRRAIAKSYEEAFKGKDFILGQPGLIEGHAYHLYVIEVKDRIGLYNYLREKNIFTQIHYIPCHLMPYYREQGWKDGDLPLSENYYRRCISLPMYPILSLDEQTYTINAIYDFFSN